MNLFTPDFKCTPYWWDHAPELPLSQRDLPKSADVVIIGSGYTGLNAALVTARGGRSTCVLDAEAAGWGCSSRNGGQISTSIKPNMGELAHRHGLERAKAIRTEGREALEWIERFVRDEELNCDFKRCGRFHAAHTPKHFDQLAENVAPLASEGIEMVMVPRSEQRSELGTDSYFGGALFPQHSALDPSLYHRALLDRANQAGALVIPFTPAISIERCADRFKIETPRGTIDAEEILVATNGYSTALVPWLRRRIIPIGSYIIATEPLQPEIMDRLFPADRVASDTCRVVYYYRPSPDRKRILFGGRVSANETDPRKSAPPLHRDMVRIFPELADSKISHSWCGTVAYSFDSLAHIGTHEGIRYAMGYCGSGVSMASYLGMRAGQQILGLDEGRTAFDNLPFPTRPLYSGRPWFLPAMVSYFRWLDRWEHRKAIAYTMGTETIPPK